MKEMKFREWQVLARHGKYAEEVDVKSLTRPVSVDGIEVPETLNGITLGQLMQLQDVKDVQEAFIVPCMVLLGMERSEVMECKATEVVRLSAWVSREVERIGGLFAKCQVEPGEKEKRAGIDRLNFGIFGLIDWFARRMGITDHEKVERVPWVRVYKCMQMDAEMKRYEKRLNDIYRRENERRK